MKFLLHQIYLDICIFFWKNGSLLTVIYTPTAKCKEICFQIFYKAKLPLLTLTNTLQILKRNFIPTLTDENGCIFCYTYIEEKNL